MFNVPFDADPGIESQALSVYGRVATGTVLLGVTSDGLGPLEE